MRNEHRKTNARESIENQFYSAGALITFFKRRRNKVKKKMRCVRARVLCTLIYILALIFITGYFFFYLSHFFRCSCYALV